MTLFIRLADAPSACLISCLVSLRMHDICYVLHVYLNFFLGFLINLPLQFAPAYHDYVLYNHYEGEEGATRYRTRTFVPTGQEMDMVRKSKNMSGNNDSWLSSGSGNSTPRNQSATRDTSKPEATNSSLLMESSSISMPYEMSLIDLDIPNYSGKVPPAKYTGTR